MLWCFSGTYGGDIWGPEREMVMALLGGYYGGDGQGARNGYGVAWRAYGGGIRRAGREIVMVFSVTYGGDILVAERKWLWRCSVHIWWTCSGVDSAFSDAALCCGLAGRDTSWMKVGQWR
jgi:hypothetical protein